MTLSFRSGSSILHPLWPFSVSLFIPGVPSGGASGSFSDEWKQSKAASNGYTGHHPFCLVLSPQPTWASILAATFPLKCRTEEVGSSVVSGSMNSFLFSASLTPSLHRACSPHVAEFLFPHLSGAVPLNYILRLFQLWFKIQMYPESYQTILSAYKEGTCEVQKSLVFLKQNFRVFVVQSLSCAQLISTRWTVAGQAILSTEFSRQEYWSGLPFPSPGDLPDPGIESTSPLQDSLPLRHRGSPDITILLNKMI